MLYEAYIDDSLTGDGQSLVGSIGCLVATSGQWVEFETRWREAMCAGGASGRVFHMTDVLAGRGEFQDFTTAEQKNNLVRALVRVLVDSDIRLGFCSSVSVREYDESYEEFPEFKPRSIYQMNLQRTMRAVIEGVQPTADNPVVFFIETDQRVEAHAVAVFYANIREMGWERILPTITPLPKGPIPLQAADLLAWEGSTHASRHRFGTTPRPARGSYAALRDLPNFEFYIISKQGMMNAIAGTAIKSSHAANNPAWKAARRRDQEFGMELMRRERGPSAKKGKK
ncbi:MAG: hypothetical protein SF182_07935 [Deltaproteobacteria bacterium]|nr:hypothetical protein [Deltaproteobacteria bacterium]